MSTRFRSFSRTILWVALLIAVLALPMVVLAANTVVSPSSLDGWGPQNVLGSGTVGITADRPRDGTGSLKLTSQASGDKAEYQKSWADSTRTLGSLSDVSFEFYRDASSTAAVHLGPVLRLLFWEDNAPLGSFGAEDHYGTLVWEQTYNGIATVPTNAWQSHNVFNTGKFWMRLTGGPNTAGGCNKTIENFNVTLSDWLTGNPQGQPGNCTAPDINANTYIYGLNTGIGSGWAGTFVGYVDNVVVAFGSDVVSANFELDPPCTTTCYADVVNGSDTNDGKTPATAFKTIQKAVTTVQAGGQVIAAGGTYVENVVIAKSLTLTGAGQTDDANGTVIDGTGRTGAGITVNTGIQNVTIEDLRVEDFAGTNGNGIRVLGNANGLKVEDVTADNNGTGNPGGGVYVSGPVDNVTINRVTATNNRSRGIVLWDGHKTNLTITNNVATGNNCCGIEVQDGTASGVTATDNTVTNNTDSGMSFLGLMAGAGPNLIANNTLTNNGRFGIEIKLPNGTGLPTGDGSIVVENNTVTMTTPPTSLFDFAGIAAFRRGWHIAAHADIPTGVIIRNNTVSGYVQNNATSVSEGFGIVVEGINMTVTGNTLNNNEVGVQVQGGHTPYTPNASGDGNQNNVPDQFFGRGNSPIGCAVIDTNTFSGNGADAREVGTGQMAAARNVQTGEVFCTIQAAINDADTLAGHTIEVYPGTHAENVTVNKPLTIKGSDPLTTIVDPATGNGIAISASDVTLESMTVQGAAQGANISGPRENITFDNMRFVNNTSRGIEIGNALSPARNIRVIDSFFEANNIAIRMSSTTIVDGLLIEGSTFQNQAFGFYQATDGNDGHVKNLRVTDSSFTNHSQHGVYLEEGVGVEVDLSTFAGNFTGVYLYDAYNSAANGGISDDINIHDNTFTDHMYAPVRVRGVNENGLGGDFTVDNNVFNQDVGDLAIPAPVTVTPIIEVSLQAGHTHGTVNVTNNDITLSGAFDNETAVYGVKVRGSVDVVNITGNTIDGGGVGNNGGVPPTAGIYVVSNEPAYGALKATSDINVTQNLLKNLPIGVVIYDEVAAAYGGVPSGVTLQINNNDLSDNSAYGIQSGTGDESDGTCNWWGDATGPGGEGPGSGADVSANVDYTPWLFSDDLDGDCVAGGTITVVKATTPDGDTTEFEFDPSWGPNFTLSDGQQVTSAPLPPGNYTVAEINLPALWVLDKAECSNGTTTADPASIPVAAGEQWTCTFENTSIPLCSDTCYVDAANGSDTTNGGTSSTDAFKTIQKAIDTVAPGGVVRVLPGNYSETAANRTVLAGLPGAQGPYTFGLFIPHTTKDGITIQGVTAGDANITDPNATQAVITTNATNGFGPSGIWVEADDVTIAGLEIGTNSAGQNKTIEIIGNAFTLKDSFVNDPMGSVYFNDWQFDETGNTSHLQSYAIDNNVFASGVSIDLTSGAGYSGPVDGRQITDNVFELGPGEYWPVISFSGSGTGVVWFKYSVGGAVITGNTFKNTDYGAEQWIRARGDYDNSQFDWASYWNDNTYDNAVVFGPNPPTDVGTYSYTSGAYTFNDVRTIGAMIQPQIDHATANDTVLVNEGTYVEQVVVPKTLTLRGEDGRDETFIKAPTTIPVASNENSAIVKITGAGVDVEMSGFTVTGPGPTDCGSIGAGIVVRDGAHANIHDNRIADIKDTGLSGCQNGIGIFVGRVSWNTTGTADITDNLFTGYQKLGLVVSNAGSHADIEGNTFEGDGPISYIAENGVQVSGGATAEIVGNTITGHSYTPATYAAAGMLLYGPGEINTDGNTVTNNQVGIWLIEPPGTHKNNTISATAAGSPYHYGMIVDAPPPGRVPAPVDSEMALPQTNAPSANVPAVTQTVVVTGNTFTSDNSEGGVGLEVDGGYAAADIDVTATKNIIHNWDTGVAVYECTGDACSTGTLANVDINRNSIVGNDTGFEADTVDPQETDGTCNWWGDASGPSGEGPGTGDSVTTEVDFTPWLRTSDLDGPCYVGGTISIDKVAAGAGALEFEFDLSWSDDNIKLKDGDEPFVTNPPLQAGNYSVIEVNPPAGWESVSAACDNSATPDTVEVASPANLTVADGDAWVCVFTNGPLGTVKIDKVAEGGGATVFSFDVSWSDDHVTLTDSAEMTPVALAAGNYTIVETDMPAGWTSQEATCDNEATPATELVDPGQLAVASGEKWVCKFTNVKLGTVKIDKVAAGGDTTEFTFDVSWSDDHVTLTDSGVMTPVALTAGNYTIAEIDTPAGWTLDNSTCVNGQETAPVTAIPVENGDAWVCTFTNVKLGTIQITKVAEGAGQLEFEFDVSWSDDNIKLTDGASSTPAPLAAGNYSVTEVDPPAGWESVSATCDNTTTTPAVEEVDPQSITVANGDAWVCTFTNSLQGTIRIDKVAAGGDTTEFTFDVSWSEAHVKLTDGGVMTPVALTAGNYTIAEIDTPAGWTLDNSTCVNGQETAPVTAIPVENGDAWVCTFTNVKLGTVQIAKVAAGGEATAFTFDVSWSTTNVTVMGGQSSTPVALEANTYSVTELPPPAGWTLTNAVCANGQEMAAVTAIPVENGDAWVCTFTNAYTPPPTNTCPVEGSGSSYTDLLGMGMGNGKKHKNQVKINLPSGTNLVDLYGQMVAKASGQAKYVRFIMPGKGNYVQVNSANGPAEIYQGNFWYGSDIYDTGTAPKWVKGQWFLQKSGTKSHIPRAFVLYATYQHATNRYVNVWDTYTPAEGEVYWETGAGWTQMREILVPIAAPLGKTTFNVELALVDNDKDTRPIWVTVTAGGVTQTQTPAGPSNGEQLNLMTFTLADVPAGTNQIVIEVYSPSPSIDGVNGDSATLVGMAANYMCAPLNP